MGYAYQPNSNKFNINFNLFVTVNLFCIANFDCYYGNTNFNKKWLSKIPDTILEREVASGVSRVKLKI